MLWLQLYVEGDDLGALILCARAPGAFIEEQLGLLVAAHAAHGDPQPADPGARPGGQGPYRADEGMLMERYQVSGERAFLLSTRISQDSDRKLVEVARSWSSPALLLARTDCHRHRRELFLPAGQVRASDGRHDPPSWLEPPAAASAGTTLPRVAGSSTDLLWPAGEAFRGWRLPDA